MSYFLGIDIGTFESKGVLVDGAGNIVASGARAHRMIVPRPGFAEHRAREDWWEDFSHISHALLAESRIPASEIKAVGVSAIGPCMLPVDAGGEPLTNAVLYGVDTRAALEIEELTRQIGEDVLLDRCGNSLTSQSVGPKILWLKRHVPAAFSRVHKILTSTSYLVHRLTGFYVIDHYTAANFSPLYFVEEAKWSDEFAPGIISPEHLPDLAWTTDVIGEVTKQAAEETGLAAGTPVIAGTVDAAAEAISVGALECGDMMLMYGSTVFVIMIMAQRVRDKRLWYAPWLFPHQHASMAGLAASGTLTHWFRETFARELEGAGAFAALAAEAAASPAGAKGLVLLPYFSGERTPIHDPHAKGVLFGLDLTHRRGDVFRALLEGIAYGTNHIVEAFLEAGQDPQAILAVGGGTKNRVWMQATSDVLGRTQILREKTVGASYGDAFLAALSVGAVVPDDIKAWNPRAFELAPDPSNVGIYKQGYALYRDIYRRTRDLMRRPAM